MKHKITTLLLIPLAFSIAFAVSADANSRKVRIKMTGCLENGAQPNTFVLNNITKGYTRRNTTGQAPQALARTEDFILIPQGKVNLQNHVGQQVKISGWVPSESSSAGYTSSQNDMSKLRVTKIYKTSGSCQ